MRPRVPLVLVVTAALSLVWPAGRPAGAHGKLVNIAVTCVTPDPGRPLVKFCTAALRYADGDPARGGTFRLTATREGSDGAALGPVVFAPADEEGIHSATITFPAYGRWRMKFQAIAPDGTAELVEDLLPPVPGSSPALAARLQVVLRFGAADVRNIAVRTVHLLAAVSWFALVSLVFVVSMVVPAAYRGRSLHRVARIFPWAGGASLFFLGISGMYLARFNAPSPVPGLFAPSALAKLPFGQAYLVVFMVKMILMLAILGAAIALTLALRRAYASALPPATGAATDSGTVIPHRAVRRLAVVNIGLGLLVFVSVTILSYLHMIAHVGAAAGAR